MFKRNFSAHLDHLREMLDFVEDYCIQRGVNSPTIKKIILATEEAIVNIIKHGYGKEINIVEIICEPYANSKPGIQIVIKDYGIPFNPIQRAEQEKKLPSSKQREGGFGIFLYLEMMDKVEYKREENANFLYLIKYY